MIGTKIEWATDTVNFWWGCTKVSPACQHCYAETLDARFNGGHWGKDAQRMIRVEKAIGELQKIARRGHKTGERPRVFVNSMSDFFEDRLDLDEARLRALDAMRQAPHVDFLLLTKRPEKIRELLGLLKCEAWKKPAQPELAIWLDDWINGTAPRNLWMGTTVENQEWADKRIPELLKVPAAVRFLSVEPMLGPVQLGDLAFWLDEHGKIGPTDGRDGDEFPEIHWVICGGESGANPRPMHPDWARSLRDQCAAAGVPFLFKQWGDLLPYQERGDGLLWPASDEPNSRRGIVEGADAVGPSWIWPKGFSHAHRRVGKKAAGRLLDGVEHNGFPQLQTCAPD